MLKKGNKRKADNGLNSNGVSNIPERCKILKVPLHSANIITSTRKH